MFFSVHLMFNLNFTICQFQKNEKYHRDFQEFMTAPLTPVEIDQFVATLTILRKQFNTYIDQHQKEMKNN